ncbi:hypothetical protein CcaverHIS641_0511550 [Cutaneotrichosporon cavernicola]|nr:hypothetical protein CcaverHIS641_0511550 [Cutaneotrichosporon cavernicola]
MAKLNTPMTELFGVQHPIMLAGMSVAAGPKLAAAVTNAGGLGVIGGVRATPKYLRSQIHEIKKHLSDPNGAFGVDLLLPQLGGSARKTNKDYTNGQLDDLISVVIEEGAKLFVSAVGVPPKEVVDRLHKHGIVVMNMVGHPKHVPKALAVGVDIICAQGGEGGGHTGDVPFSILIPACVDACKGKTSPLTGKPIMVIAAGGIADGRGLAASLMYGADGVWVGTRFVASVEAGAPPKHKESVLTAGFGDARRTLIYSGRPMRVRYTDYVKDWEENRQEEIKLLTEQGIIPHEDHMAKHPETGAKGLKFLMGDVASVIDSVKSAKDIVDEMVTTAVRCIQVGVADISVWAAKPVELSYDVLEPETKGRGCMVICHGLLGSKANWRGLARRFAKELNMPVYTLDLRNHGRSPHAQPHTYPAMAVDVAHFLTSHGLEDVNLLGHSMGGKTVMALALNDKLNKPLKSLISVDIAPTNEPIEPQYDSYLRGMREIEAAHLTSRKEADKMMEPYEADAGVRQFLLTNAVMEDGHVCFRVGIDTLASATRGLGTFPYHVKDGRPEATWDGPTLFLRGSRSDYVLDKHLPDARKLFPHLEVETLDAGHWVHAELPRETGDAVIAFVRRSQSRL